MRTIDPTGARGRICGLPAVRFKRAELSALVAVAALAIAPLARAQPLIVAMEPQVSAAPLAIAMERGWFLEEGLDVQLVPFHANQTMAMALAEGDVDIALVDISADTLAMAAARNLRVIAAGELLDRAHPRHAWVVAADHAAGGLEGLAADAVFGLTEAGSIARFLLAQRAPATAETVRYAIEGSDVALAAALVQGRVQGALLPAHLAADLGATGAAVVVGWAGEVEGPVLRSALVTSAAQASLRPDGLQRFLRAYVRGLRVYRQSVLAPIGDEDVYLAAERDALVRMVAATARRPAAELLAAPPYFAIDGRIPQRSFAAQLRWWQLAGVCPADIEPLALVDNRPLDAALAALAAEAVGQRESATPPGTAAGAEQVTAAPAPTDPVAAGGP